jgi:hypothetical protein
LAPVILTCLAITLAIYAILSSIIQPGNETRVISFFAASGVSCHYWFRIHALLCFDDFGLTAWQYIKEKRVLFLKLQLKKHLYYGIE